MRKLVGVLGVLSVVLLAMGRNRPVAQAQDLCTAPCMDNVTLSCTVATGTCSATGGSVTCCGQTLTCTAINAWNACYSACGTALVQCKATCDNLPLGQQAVCNRTCGLKEQTCENACGTEPTTSLSC
jgi:hypothetical protein